MNRIGALLVPALIALLLAVACQQYKLSETEAHLLLDSLEHKLHWLHFRLFEESWDFYTTGRSDSLDFYQGLYSHVTTDRQTLRRLQAAEPLFVDEVDRRRRQLAHAELLLAQVESREKIEKLRDSLLHVDITYRAEFEGKERTNAFLYETYRSDPNRDRRERAYRAWCSVGDSLADGLGQLIRLRNQKAHRMGYSSYLSMVFNEQEIDQIEYLSLLNRLDSLTLEPYTNVLAGIAGRLSLSDVEVWDLGYAYADIRQPVDRYFPADSQMPIIHRSLKQIGFDIDKLPIYFDLESREGKSQLAYAFPVKPPHDVRVLANMTDGLYSLRTLLHEIGHALHFAHIEQERPLFNNSMSGSWEEGMAQTVAALCDEREWLLRYGRLPLRLAERYLEAKKEREIISIRVSLLRLYF
ncbi:MAG: M3 family metallopeptidase, partial [Candidatus Zixiibacteriota bacterium]